MTETPPPAFSPLDDPAHVPVTLTARVAEQVRDAIADGRLKPNMRLSVPQLAEQLGASRTPVREALLLLESQGLVRFERNRGVRILETALHDLDEIFTLRLLLEVPATRRAAERMSAADRAALRKQLDEMARHAASGDEAAFMAADRRFHDLLLRAAGNRRLAATVIMMRDQVRFLGASTVGRSRTLATILAEHEAIATRLESGDAAGAADAMREHLVATASLLLAQESGRSAPYELAWAALDDD